MTAAIAAALLCIRTTDALRAALLFSDYIEDNADQNTREYRENDEILHNYLASAYSALIFLLDFAMSDPMIPAITSIAASPAIAAPTLRVAGAVTSVPIVYTK